MFRFNKTIIREPTVCASLKSQVPFVCVSCTVHSETVTVSLCTVHDAHTNGTG